MSRHKKLKYIITRSVKPRYFTGIIWLKHQNRAQKFNTYSEAREICDLQNRSNGVTYYVEVV